MIMQWEIAYLSDHVIQIAVYEGTFDLVSAPGVQFSSEGEHRLVHRNWWRISPQRNCLNKLVEL